MSIVSFQEDSVNTPGVKTAAGATVTSNSFSPPAQSLVIVLVSHGNVTTNTTVTSSPSVTWTNAAQISQSFDSSNAGIFYHYYATAPGAITVTTAATSAANFFQDIRVILGANATQPGVTGTTAVSSSTVFNKSVTTTKPMSLVYGLATYHSFATTLTPVAGFTTLNTNNINPTAYDASGSRIVTSPAATTVGWTNGGASDGSICFVEFLPAVLQNSDSSSLVPLIRTFSF